MLQAGYAPKPAIQKRENVTFFYACLMADEETGKHTDGEVICPLHPKPHPCSEFENSCRWNHHAVPTRPARITQSRPTMSQKHA
jgi:hypothetical protein